MIRRPIPARTVRLIPLLGSPVDAEALSTCRAIVTTLAVDGLDLHDLAAAVLTSPKPIRASAGPAPSFFDMVRAVRDLDGGRLSVRERQFVESMRRLGNRSPSPAQARWLADIFDRLTRRAA